jgi:hypothetical protein
MPVFIQQGESNQYILKEHFQMVHLKINMVVKGFWKHAWWDPTLLVNLHLN